MKNNQLFFCIRTFFFFPNSKNKLFSNSQKKENHEPKLLFFSPLNKVITLREKN